MFRLNELKPLIVTLFILSPFITLAQAVFNITEIYPGQAGSDLTPDWFEIKNTGSDWVYGIDSNLYYDDESMSVKDAVKITGLTSMKSGEYAIVLLTKDTADVTTFRNIWGAVIDLSNIRVGYCDGAGLGDADMVTLWLGDPAQTVLADTCSYRKSTIHDGKTYDAELMVYSTEWNANGAVQTLATAGSSGTVPNVGSPGNGRAIPVKPSFMITEIYPGQAGSDLTPDWFEIKNTGSDWAYGIDSNLYYDDESMSAKDAVKIEGLTFIKSGGYAVVLLTKDTADVTAFRNIWGAVIDLSNIQIGYCYGAGLGDADMATLWLGNPNKFVPVDTASYPVSTAFDGQTYDVELATFSTIGNANGAVQTLVTAGSTGDVPNVGSPGNGKSIKKAPKFIVTEIFPGQSGFDLTADWFEIKNIGGDWNVDTDSALYYDDESMSATDAVPVLGINSIKSGEYAIVMVASDTTEIANFRYVWIEVTHLAGVKIGYTDGAGLGDGGDMVTLWMGNPNLSDPVDTASFPDMVNHDGHSFDIELRNFSEVGNASNAVKTIEFGGDNNDVPNVASPGNREPKKVDALSQNETPTLKLFPNPSKENLLVSIDQDAAIQNLRIISLQGKDVYSSKHLNSSKIQLNLSHLPSGVYLVNVLTNKGLVSEKLLVE